MIRGSFVRAFCLLAGTALAACGGGGSKQGTQQPPPPPPVSKYTVGGTVSGLNGTVVLQNSGSDALTVKVNGAFVFDTSLTANSTYDVTVKTQPTAPDQTCTVTNGSGSVTTANVTNVAVTCQTVVRNAAWGTAMLIEHEDLGDAVRPRVALDAGGNARFVWDQSDGTYQIVRSNQLSSQRVLSEPVKISDAIGDGYLPSLGPAGSGTAYATWIQKDGANFYATASHFDGTNWSSPTALYLGAGLLYEGPRVVTNASGAAIATWTQSNGTQRIVMVSQYSSTEGWSTPFSAQLDETHAGYQPRAAMSANGAAMIVWRQQDDTETNIWALRYSETKGWGVPTLVEEDKDAAADPDVAMDANGNAVVVFVQNFGADLLWRRACDANGVWGLVQLLDTFADAGARAPRIAMNASGDAVVVWRKLGTLINELAESHHRAGGGWSEAIKLQSSGVPQTQSQEVAINSSGEAQVVWLEGDATHNNVVARRYSPDTGWNAIMSIETGDGSALLPHIAIDDNGVAQAVWSQQDTSGRYDIWTNRFE